MIVLMRTTKIGLTLCRVMGRVIYEKFSKVYGWRSGSWVRPIRGSDSGLCLR